MSDRCRQLIDEIAEFNRTLDWIRSVKAELEAGDVPDERLDEIMGRVPAACK